MKTIKPENRSSSLSVSGFEILYGATSFYWIALPTCENTVFAFVPIKRTVPITITRITASMTAYSAMSCPCSSFHILFKKFLTVISLKVRVRNLDFCRPDLALSHRGDPDLHVLK